MGRNVEGAGAALGPRRWGMVMKRLLVLGGGTAGTMVVNKLRSRLKVDDWQITVVDRDGDHLYQPGLLLLPFGVYDRDDLVQLAFAVDDVADAAENASELLGLYGVDRPTKQAFLLCELLVRAVEQLAQLLGRLRTVQGSAEEIVAIKAIEDEADDVARAARASLFKDDRIDPMIVIRWKDVYEALEDAVDACETAAHRIGNILVKNA